MNNYTVPRTKTRKTLRTATVGLIVIITAMVGTFVFQSVSSSAPSLFEVARDNPEVTMIEDTVGTDLRGAPSRPEGEHDDGPHEAAGVLTEDDGLIPGAVSAFDDAYPGVANLEIELLNALREAATEAAAHGIDIYVTSGWRSPEYQNQLLREAIVEYGSEAEASRWVASPETSAHVSGDAVDIGPFDALEWMSANGADYGLCQIYGNEPWHFELRPDAIEQGCPAMYADPTHDPRMQK